MAESHLHLVTNPEEPSTEQPQGNKQSPPNAPLDAARELFEAKFTHEGQLTIRHWRGRFYKWRGSHWTEIEENKLHRVAYEFFARAWYLNKKGEPENWHPDPAKIGKLYRAAAAALCHLDGTQEQPFWIGEDRGQVIACANGLLRLELVPVAAVLQPDGSAVRLRRRSSGTGVARVPGLDLGRRRRTDPRLAGVDGLRDLGPD